MIAPIVAPALIPLEYDDGTRPRFKLRAQHAPALFGFLDKRSGRPRARSIRDAAQSLVVPKRVAKNARRSSQLDNWLPVSIPDALAFTFGCGASADAGRALLRQRLARLCAWLNRRLEEPPIAIQRGPSRQVTIFGCVGYNVDFVLRRVSGARIFPNGARQELSVEVELLQPLTTSYWLSWVIEDLGLSAGKAQLPLFATANEACLHDQWLVDTAYGLLKADPRFEELRKETLPQAFALPREFVSLSLLSRHAHWTSGFVPRSTFNLVWQHETLFRRVARESPQLLKLLEVFLWYDKLPLVQDPVAEMRDYFRACGFTDATWRYVHKHGSRLFRAAWEISVDKSKLAVSISYLRELEAAGLPPPPAPSLAVAWFRCFAGLHSGVQFRGNWCTADSTVIRAVLLEGDRRRCEPDFARYVGDAVGVLHWAMETSLTLNPQQARSGWKWLYRNWHAWRESRQREEAVCGLSWQSRLQRMTIGRFEIIPIESSIGLVAEALAMHNCADTLAQRCVSDDFRMFSVRRAGSGERVATLCILSSIIMNGEIRSESWIEYQVKRAANRPATRELEQLMTEVAQLYTECCRTGPGHMVLDACM